MAWQPQRGNISIAGLGLCTLIGLLLGTSAFTFHYAQGTSYLSNDPAACVNCHIMRPQYDSWQKSSHHAVATCNDCHVPHDVLGKWLTKADNGFWHSYYFTFQNFYEPIQLRPVSKDVLQHNCLYCHKPFVNDILGHPRGFADEPTDCIRCHSTVGHGGR